MSETGTLTRRNFLVAGIAVGVIGIIGSDSVEAAETTLARLINNKRCATIDYLQLHCTADFPLTTALSLLETVTQAYTLEKVSVAGDPEFETLPTNFLATFCYKGGLRATITSGRSPHPSIGTIRGSKDDIIVQSKRLEVIDDEGKVQESLLFNTTDAGSTTQGMDYILQALRKGITVFPAGVTP
jgi:hypothetical protein